MALYQHDRILLLCEKAAEEGDAVTAVIMGLTAVESFLNSAVSIASPELDGHMVAHPDAIKFGRALTTAERLPLRRRLDLAVILMTGESLSWGTLPFQDLLFVTALRNEIIHDKPAQLVSSDAELVGALRRLESLGLIEREFKKDGSSRLHATSQLWQTKRVANWAASTSTATTDWLRRSVPAEWDKIVHELLRTPHSPTPYGIKS